jgi:creatinine amidohydrolase
MQHSRFVAACAALALAPAAPAAAAQAPRTRFLNELNWMEVAELVPARISTVLLPVGTLEAHGVGPNGADNLVPEALARDLAPELDALVAPLIPYGVNTSLDEYPGTFGVSEGAFRAYAESVLRGLARMGIRNIVVLNGHGPNYGPLNDAALAVFRDTDARILVLNWWTLTEDVTQEVFGTTGGHAGVNETAALLAVAPDHVHPQRYRPEQASPLQPDAWRAYPFPSAIGLYRAGAGYPEFDRAKAARYWRRVEERVLALVRDVLAKWDAGGR